MNITVPQAGINKKTSKYEINNSTSMVIYRYNLGSTIDKGKYSLSLKNLIFLTSNSYSIIVGNLLSDGWLEKSSVSQKSNTRFKFNQAISRSDYVISEFMALSHYCSNMPYILKGRRKEVTLYSLEFSTRYLPCFNLMNYIYYSIINKLK